MLGKKQVNRPEHARNRFLKSMNCSQAIVETYAPSLGITVEQARRVAAAFAGGMGMGSECGAVTGALMVIGLKFGKTLDSDSQANAETFKHVASFINAFKAQHKHLSCSGLLDSKMWTPEGINNATEKEYFTSRCPEYVKSAAEILDKILTKDK